MQIFFSKNLLINVSSTGLIVIGTVAGALTANPAVIYCYTALTPFNFAISLVSFFFCGSFEMST